MRVIGDVRSHICGDVTERLDCGCDVWTRALREIVDTSLNRTRGFPDRVFHRDDLIRDPIHEAFLTAFHRVFRARANIGSIRKRFD